MSAPLFALTLATALGAGLVAGVFFAFSTFVMPALERLPADQGVAAMQSINRTVTTPSFMLVFVGTAVLCAVLVVVAAVGWGEPRAPWLLAGGLVYALGSFVLTMAYHVPRNDALDAFDPHAAETAGRWSTFLAEWVPANTVRALASLVAAGLLVAALVAD